MLDNLLDADSSSVGKKNEPEMKKTTEILEVSDLRMCG